MNLLLSYPSIILLKLALLLVKATLPPSMEKKFLALELMEPPLTTSYPKLLRPKRDVLLMYVIRRSGEKPLHRTKKWQRILPSISSLLGNIRMYKAHFTRRQALTLIRIAPCSSSLRYLSFRKLLTRRAIVQIILYP